MTRARDEERDRIIAWMLNQYTGSSQPSKMVMELARLLQRNEHRPPLPQKYGILHPSDRPLGLGHDGTEMWGADDHLVLFDTISEALAHIKERSRQFPNGDWPQARVAMYTPGVDRVYPRWHDLPQRREVILVNADGAEQIGTVEK